MQTFGLIEFNFSSSDKIEDEITVHNKCNIIKIPFSGFECKTIDTITWICEFNNSQLSMQLYAEKNQGEVFRFKKTNISPNIRNFSASGFQVFGDYEFSYSDSSYHYNKENDFIIMLLHCEIINSPNEAVHVGTLIPQIRIQYSLNRKNAESCILDVSFLKNNNEQFIFYILNFI